MLTNLFSLRFTRAKRISSSWILHKKRATDRIWTGDLILTKDALYQLSYCSFLLRSVDGYLASFRQVLSGRRGSNPPPIAWKAIALPNELLPLLCRFVGKSGLEPLNSEEDRFTVCCNCHYATSPYFFSDASLWSFFEPMKGLEPPTGWLQISYSTNWVIPAWCERTVGFFLPPFSPRKGVQK